MIPTSPRLVSMPLTTTVPSGMTRLDCTDCGCDLAIHLPDPQMPERMLATCEECGCWFLVDAIADTSEAVMIRLPDYGCNWAAMRN